MTASSDHTRYLELLERTNAELNIMMEIGKALTSSLDLQEVLQLIMQKVSQLLKPGNCSLLLVDEQTTELYRIAVPTGDDQPHQGRIEPGQGVPGWVALHGMPLLIRDPHNDPRFRDLNPAGSASMAGSVVCVPLKIRERVLGVIELASAANQAHFTELDLNVLAAMADYAAIAIDNARSFRLMNELVITDDLTGLYNANHFHTLLDQEMERSRRYGAPFSLVFLDLDRFKQVNDTHGHLVGSRLLAEYGRLLKKHTRCTDRAARYGGDEFVIILPETSKRGALFMVMNLRRILASHHFVNDGGERIQVTASYGIASFPEDADNKRALIQAADMAMYEVKESSRDGIKACGTDLVR